MSVSLQCNKSASAKGRFLNLLILAAIITSILGLVLLGNWQMRRLDWKLSLIERVENRANAVPVVAPTAVDWPGITRQSDEYRRVTIQGQFLHQRETLVWALTERGNGYWVLTPLLTAADETVLINRGYVPVAFANPTQRKAGQVVGKVSVTGLLRISEPDGIPLRDNDPLADRWYSRDVAAIARVRKLDNVAPYFIDADATANPGGLPIGGLTRLHFRNSHLIYALCWYGLALLLAVLTARVIWIELGARKADKS